MEGKNVNVELPVEGWNLVLQALGKFPFEQTASLIFEIKKQAEAQIQADQEPVQTEE